jgi:hypothetical protein
MTARKDIFRTNDGSVPTVKRNAAAEGARLIRNIASFDLATVQIVSGDTLGLGKVPKGAIGVSHRMTASATMGATATIAIGIAGTTGKYRTAAVFTAVDTPTAVGKASTLDDTLAADEDHIATIAAADLPASGLLTIETFYTLPGR